MSSQASLGKLYGPVSHMRSNKSKIAALYVNHRIDYDDNFAMGVDNKKPEYLSKFPLGQVPAFELTQNNNEVQVLTESSAIAFYIALKGKQSYNLLGDDEYQFAKIMQFILFFETQIDVHILKILLPILYNYEYNKAAEVEAFTKLHKSLDYLNKYLLENTYLVGHKVTLADIIATCTLRWVFEYLLDNEARKEYINVTRYYTTISYQPEIFKVNGEPKFSDKVTKYDKQKQQMSSKDNQAPRQSEKSSSQTQQENTQDNESSAPVKKPKSKLELLPKSPFDLEAWKRYYSNNDTRPTAMNYFWKEFDKEGYSIWKVDYKYNSELTLGFMSCNLIAGFFNRLERAHKYAFGSMVVLGKDNENVIRGYFVIRGNDIPEEVTDAADFESFDFKKIEDFESNPETREHIAAYFAWDDVIDGLPLIDGKVFK